MRLYFIHGAGCDASVFREQAGAFAGARVATLPGRGDGASPSTVGEFADAVSADLTGLGWDDVVLCGSSLGGAVALELALRRDPRVRRLALIGSGARMRVAPAFFEQLERDFPAGARSFASAFFADPEPSRVEAAVALMLRVGQAQTVRDLRACHAFDVTERLGELRLPLLAIAGERDVLTPPKFAQFIADRVPGASARILLAAGHLAMIERPEETNAALRAFVGPT